MIPQVVNINGCFVALLKMDSVKAVMVQVIVSHGSINEPGTNWGAIHLMEHMSMDATKKFPDQTSIEEFKEDNGIRTGAWTGPFSMGYWFKFPSINQIKGFELMNEILFNPLLSERDLIRETKIIEQEYVDAWSNPKRRFVRSIKNQLYGKGHPFLRDGMGQPEYIKTLNSDDIKDMHKKVVFPANMVVSIVGSFDEKSVINALSDLLESRKNGQITKAIIPKPKPSKKFINHFEKGDRVEIVYQWMGPGRDKLSMKDRIATGVARYMLGGSNRSFLQKKLRGEQGLVYSCGAGLSFSPISSVFDIAASTSSDRASQVFKEMNKVIDFVLTGEITENQFQRSRKFMDLQTLMLYDSVDNISNDLVNSLFWEKRIYTPDEMVALASNVSLEDIKKIYKNYFLADKYVAVMSEKKIQSVEK